MSDDSEFFERVGTQQRHSGNIRAQAQYSGELSAPTPVKELQFTGSGTSWASSGEVFWRIGQSHDRLPAGIYRCEHSPSIGPHFVAVRNDTDKLIQFPDSASEDLIKEIAAFQGMKAKFVEHGFLHKRGVLMWGPPGSGKTTTLQLLIKLIVGQHGGVAVQIENPQVAVLCLQMLRAVEAERQIVCVIEDLDALVDRYGETEYLALLDGESQVDNVVYVATTNYPERLDGRFVDRPSRFDTVRYIGMPSASAREVYFTAKIADVTSGELADYVAVTEGYSVAHLREFIILTRCFGHSVEAACARLNKSRKVRPSSLRAPEREAFGFAGVG